MIDTKKESSSTSPCRQVKESMKDTHWRKTKINRFQKNLMNLLKSIYPQIYLGNDTFDLHIWISLLTKAKRS